MKTSTLNNKQNRNLKILLLITVAALLSACGNSKSSTPAVQSSNNLVLGSQKPLAQCNKSKDANISFNVSTVVDQSGQTSPDWIKFKFNHLSASMTQSGNVIKFFKWRVAGTQTVLDETPLQVAAYNFSTGQTASQSVTSLDASQVNGQYGYYIGLNDPNSLFQVVKVVIYNSQGQVVGNINSLIPAFYASPTDYQFNADGSPRAALLQQMHGLYGQNVAGWSTAQMQQHFNQYCF